MRKSNWLYVILFSVLLWLPLSSGAVTTSLAPLLPDQAFQLSTSVDSATQAFVQWHIAPGYFLYVKHTKVNVTSNTPADIQYPHGEIKHDAARGKFEAYSGDLVVPVILKAPASSVTLSIDYQGCSQDGFCYPPMHSTVTLQMASTAAVKPVVTLQNLLTDQNNVQSLFYNQHLSVLLLIFVGLGLLLAFTPCVLPMIPIITSIIVGQQKAVSTMKAFLLSLTYVLGMAITYAFAGVIAALF